MKLINLEIDTEIESIGESIALKVKEYTANQPGNYYRMILQDGYRVCFKGCSREELLLSAEIGLNIYKDLKYEKVK